MTSSDGSRIFFSTEEFLAALEKIIDEPLLCVRCGKPAGKDYHTVGASTSGEVTCDGCWDERLR